MDFEPETHNQGGVLPADLVDEGKLVWFLDERVVSRAPETGSRAKSERKRWAEGVAERKAKKAKTASVDDPASPSVPDVSCITVSVKTTVDKIDLTSEDEEEPFKSALTLKIQHREDLRPVLDSHAMKLKLGGVSVS